MQPVGPKHLWILITIVAAAIGFILIKEITDQERIADLKIDKVRYGDLPALSTAVESFARKTGQLPSDKLGLSALVCSRPHETGCVYHLSKDPWLHPYAYRRVSNSPGYMLYSVGTNGIDENGGGDDIVTWPKHYTCHEYGVGCISLAELIEYGALVIAISCGCFLLFFGSALLVIKLRKPLP